MKLLLIEDEIPLGESIVSFLESENYVCEWAQSMRDASLKIADFDYDCFLVDITLPGGSGLDLLKEVKAARPEAGIIIISARNSVDDKIHGLDTGADDYLTKPFHLTELNSRIRSLLRRRLNAGENQITYHDIRVEPVSRNVFVKDVPVDLTKKEFALLVYFITNKNRVMTREAIAAHIWGDDAGISDSFDFLYSHVKTLRKKLLAKGSGDYIQTVYGIGYKLVAG